jgi:signal transduction histidine kinase
VVDRNGEILGTNAQNEREGHASGMAFEKEFCVGANLLDFYRRADKAGDRVAAQILAGITAVLQGESRQFDIEWPKQKARERRWFLTSVTPLKTAAGGAVITRNEITARKQEEEERLELSGRLINLQENERSRLARELHDDFNQRLALLAIDLERTAETVVDSPEASQKLHELWNRASEIGADLHSLSHRLHSSTLESLGLVLGVSSLCGEFVTQNDIQVDFANENVPNSVPPDIALCLFRIAQEALRNVKRHSGASRAEVRLEGMKNGISLRIEDKGIGFDSSRSRAGLGIRSMQERIRLLGGRFDIRSQSGEGTVITVSVPLAVKENPADDKQVTAAR